MLTKFFVYKTLIGFDWQLLIITRALIIKVSYKCSTCKVIRQCTKLIIVLLDVILKHQYFMLKIKVKWQKLNLFNNLELYFTVFKYFFGNSNNNWKHNNHLKSKNLNSLPLKSCRTTVKQL